MKSARFHSNFQKLNKRQKRASRKRKLPTLAQKNLPRPHRNRAPHPQLTQQNMPNLQACKLASQRVEK